jgi:hypothetical protein
MHGDPTTGEYGSEAAPNYIPYRPAAKYISTAGEN